MKPEIYWIKTPWSGKLAIMPRPRGGDWLQDEIRAWKQEGLDTIVCMLTPEEMLELDIAGEPSICNQTGLDFIDFPVLDRDIPVSRGSAYNLLDKLAKALKEGRSIGIHCRMGLGRSAMAAAAVLVLAGVDPEEAFRNIAAARGFAVPDTPEQKNWVVQFAWDREKSNASGNQ